MKTLNIFVLLGLHALHTVFTKETFMKKVVSIALGVCVLSFAFIASAEEAEEARPIPKILTCSNNELEIIVNHANPEVSWVDRRNREEEAYLISFTHKGFKKLEPHDLRNLHNLDITTLLKHEVIKFPV